MLHVAWLGDSQAMLFRRGKGIELVNPHKPDREVCALHVAFNFTLVAICLRMNVSELRSLEVWSSGWGHGGSMVICQSPEPLEMARTRRSSQERLTQ